MNRDQMLDAVRGATDPWDVVIIGGGATGLGCAVDAASRGYRTALFERGDFASGTSSRSTKLIHGGVRYLRQGNFRIVVEALREQRVLERNAPELVASLDFVIPLYNRWERPYYQTGLGIYDLLARRAGATRWLTPVEATAMIPTIRRDGLRGGLVYRDAQFDDARLALSLAQTAVASGAIAVNYCPVTALTHRSGRVSGIIVEDGESGTSFEVAARVVINATGVYVDGVRRMDERAAPPIIRPSRGSHIVLGSEFLPGRCAMLVPRTEDGRVIFAIPWQGHVIVGTTDVATVETPAEPRPTTEEIDFLLLHASRYLEKDVRATDIRSAFSGLRPLVARGGGRTSALSRDHRVFVSGNGLVTISGGKWTTYRKMAEDGVDRAAQVGGLTGRPCRTARLAILSDTATDAGDGDVSSDGVRHAIQHGMARTAEDVLARRFRTLFLDARAAIREAPGVARILREELHRSESWEADEVKRFTALARTYLPNDG